MYGAGLYSGSSTSPVLLQVCGLLSYDRTWQSKTAVGTWKMDVAKSDFGGDPAPKSVTVTIIKDTPEMLSWRVHMIDDKGHAVTYLWKGPKDGSRSTLVRGLRIRDY